MSETETSPYINSVNLNSQTNFPYLVLHVVNDESYPRNPGFQVMHWHEDLQFIYVLEGEIEVATLADRLRLTRGEGVFINANVVHRVRRVAACRYDSFIFPERFLKFYAGSPAERLVDSIVGCGELPVCAIHATPDNAPVLERLQALSRLEGQRSGLYPYEVLTALCRLWLAFSRTVTVCEKPLRSRAAEERVETMLHYIAGHFSEELTLDMLAASANISRSECLRCFHALLHTTPYRYLMEYRLAQAAERLRSSDEPVSAVAARVGFDHHSHFGKCFREKTGMTPSQYRKKHRGVME